MSVVFRFIVAVEFLEFFDDIVRVEVEVFLFLALALGGLGGRVEVEGDVAFDVVDDFVGDFREVPGGVILGFAL